MVLLMGCLVKLEGMPSPTASARLVHPLTSGQGLRLVWPPTPDGRLGAAPHVAAKGIREPMSSEVLDRLWDRPDRLEERRRGLRWLADLRWWAVAGAMVGIFVAMALSWNFVSTPAVVFGLVLMVAVNVILLARTRRELQVGRNELLLHATVDLIMLTWLLAWAGGVRNPLSMAFSFHVVLGALLNGRRGALYASGVSLFCMALLWTLELTDYLPMPPLHDPPALLWALSAGVLVVGLGYLAVEVAERQVHERDLATEQQDDAEQALSLLLEVLTALRVGVDVKDKDHRTLLQNEANRARDPAAQSAIERALAKLDAAALDAAEAASAASTAAVEAAARDVNVDVDAAAKSVASESRAAQLLAPIRVTERFTVPSGDQNNRAERIIELVGLKPSHPRVSHAFLTVDRTDHFVVEQRHIMLERLATLGRAMQGVAHELNTPLTTMQTLAKDVREALKDADLPEAVFADVDESLGLIIEETRRCRSLTQTLLSTANDGHRRRGQRMSLAEVARKAVRLVGESRGAVFLDDETLADVADVDADRVLQILMNLIQNALAATRHIDDGSTRVFVSAVSDGERVRILVRDRGAGLPPLVRDRLFEPFITTKSEGTGLGLYTSLQLSRELGGDLDLEDAEGGGTLGTLTLPLSTTLTPRER